MAKTREDASNASDARSTEFCCLVKDTLVHILEV
jgi:hypothetical protein